jgi:Fic family protein
MKLASPGVEPQVGMNGALLASTLSIDRVRAEYCEAPGLRLTLEQASRFLGLDAKTCERAFQELEKAGFLSRRPDGTYQHPCRI